MLVGLLLAWAGGAGSARAADVAGNRFEGLPITEIAFSPSRQPIPEPRLGQLIAVRQGSPLRAADVRLSIQRLFATGRYSDIQVDATLAGGGVKITFLTTESWFIGAVRVLNVQEPPTPGQLTAATNLVLGELYSEEKVAAAMEALRRILAANGFQNAAIEFETNRHSDTQQIDITFFVRPGKRARFGQIRLAGRPDLTVRQLQSLTGWSPEHSFTQPAVERGLERLRRHYLGTDHIQAVIRLAEQKFLPGPNRVDLVVQIDPGPKLEMVVSGAKLSRKQLRRYIPIYEEGTIDHDLLAEGARNLRDYFQTQGYFEAKVDFTQRPEQDGVILVEFQVAPGGHHEFVKLDVTGERYFDAATIRERMLLQPKSLTNRYGRFSQDLLRSDIEAIEELYRSNGFLDVRVASEVIDDYEGNKGDIAAFLKIEEGPQTLVSSLTIKGNQAIPAKVLMEKISLTPGQPFSESNVANDRDQILGYYFSQGFEDASLEWKSAPGPEPNRVSVEYTIHEGVRQFVNQVISDGSRTTRESTIRRQIQMHAGEPLSQESMIESQRRLYDLGIFSKVDMGIQNPDGEEQYRNVIFELEEARRWTIAFGGGAEIARFGGGQFSLESPAGATGFSPRVSFDVNRLNMFGNANTLSFRSRLSTLEQRGLVTYQAPDWRGKERLTLTYSSLFDKSRDVRTFTATRLEGATQLQHRVSKASSLFYRFTYRRVSVDAASLKINPSAIPLLSQPVRVGLLSASYYQDRRDDPVDAKRGIYNSVDLGEASYYFGSAASFARLLMQNSTYHPVNRKLTLARTTQFGALIPYGRLRRVEEPDGTVIFTRDIPLPERFFSGGSSSNRGFPINQAGPRDPVTGFPVGGNGLFMNSVELRFPLKGENIEGALFHDMGNVFSQPQNLNFRFHQRNLQDFDYMVHAVGFGVRYRTPIGPIRVDLAYGINSPRFVGFNGTLQDLAAIGTNPIPANRITEQRISHFQFQFSLGQTF
jgi:outer membrane protein insertion porin family